MLPLLDASGGEQMAIDAWLLRHHQQGGPPCLRFYTWSRATISLGFHQRRFPARWHDLANAGTVDLVRRPTGGRAVLHDRDVTYAVVGSGFAGKRWDIYAHLCRFLERGWSELGIPLRYGDRDRDYARTANCFDLATGADLVTADGSKLVGSAQVRKGDAVLQHGSMRLAPNPDLWREVFGTAPDLPAIALSPEQIVPVLTAAAAECFGVEFVEQPLTAAERAAIVPEEFAVRSPASPSG